jgi:hypothetical protein
LAGCGSILAGWSRYPRAICRKVVKSWPLVSDNMSGRMADMDVSLIEPFLKLLITLEFGFLAVAGLTVVVHLVTMDAEIRRISDKQHVMIRAMKEGLEARMVEKEQKKLNMMNAMMNAA